MIKNCMSHPRRAMSFKYRQEILEGPVYSLLLKMGLPGMITLFLQAGFNLVDRFFVSRLGEELLGSVGLAFVIQSLLMALAGGLGSGLRSHTSRSVGADRREAVLEGARQISYIVIAAGVILAVAGPPVSWLLYRLMGVEHSLMAPTMAYTSIILYGAVFNLASLSGNSLLRGAGEMKAPMKYMLIGLLVNALADPLLIYGPGPFPALGIKGAALATVLGRAVGVFLMVRRLIREGAFFEKPLYPFRPERTILASIMRVGFPSMTTRSLNALGMGLIYSLVVPFGVGAAAAYTVSMTYQRLILIPVNGLSGAAVTMVGQNGGAGQIERTKDIYRKSQQLIALYIGVLSVLIIVFARLLCGLLLKDPDSIALGTRMLMLLAPGYLFMASRIASVGSLNALGYGKQGLIVSLSQKFILTFPLAWLLSRFLGLDGLWIGLSTGHFFAAGIGVFMFYYSLKKYPVKI